MKFCAQCGAQISDGQKFCSECGAPIEAAATVVEKAGDVIDSVKEKAEDVKDAVAEKAEDVKEAVADKAVEIKDAVADKTTEAVEAAGEKVDEAVEKIDETVGDIAAEEPVRKETEPVAAPAVIEEPGQDYSYVPPVGGGDTSGIAPRNIILCVVLSIITCGIYGLYWMYKLNEEINQLSGEEGTSGGIVILLSIVTCGIYTIYWEYKMGQRVDIIKGDANGSSHILFLILSLVELDIVDYILMQNTINNKVNGI